MALMGRLPESPLGFVNLVFLQKNKTPRERGFALNWIDVLSDGTAASVAAHEEAGRAAANNRPNNNRRPNDNRSSVDIWTAITIGAAMEAGPAAAGNLYDIGARRLSGRGERHRIGEARSCDHAGKECCCGEYLHMDVFLF